MGRFQLDVKIPQFLHEKLNSYVECTGTFKTEVVVDALTHYLRYTEDLPLSQRVAELEVKVEELKASLGK